MRRSAEWWSKTVEEAQGSGLSMRVFAGTKGLNYSTLSWWKWKLNQAPAPGGFLEVELVAAPLRVRVGGGVVEVDEDTDLSLLRRVVEALA